jgi:hypothetical protein
LNTTWWYITFQVFNGNLNLRRLGSHSNCWAVYIVICLSSLALYILKTERSSPSTPTCTQSIVGVCKQITILILHQVISRLVTPLKFIYSSMQVPNILVPTVRCKRFNFFFQIFPLLFLKCLLLSGLILFRLSPFISFGYDNHCNCSRFFDLKFWTSFFGPWLFLLQFIVN